MLVRQTAWKGRHTIQNRWEDEESQVVGQPASGVPFFKVQMLDGRKNRTLHKTLSLPLQGRLRQQGNMDREATSVSYIEEDGNTEVSEVPILWHVRPMSGGPTPQLQGTWLKKVPIKVTFAELGTRNGALSSVQCRPYNTTRCTFILFYHIR